MSSDYSYKNRCEQDPVLDAIVEPFEADFGDGKVSAKVLACTGSKRDAVRHDVQLCSAASVLQHRISRDTSKSISRTDLLPPIDMDASLALQSGLAALEFRTLGSSRTGRSHRGKLLLVLR